MTEIPPELVERMVARTDEDEAVAIVAAELGIHPEYVVVDALAFRIALAGIRRGKELAPVNLGGGGI